MIGRLLHTENNLSEAKGWQANVVCSKRSVGFGVMVVLQPQDNFPIFILHQYSERPTLKSPNFESMDELRSLCHDLSFIFKNSMRNSHETGNFSNFCSNFKNLSINWDKYVFYWIKWNFEILKFWKLFVYHRSFGHRKSPANTLTPLCLNDRKANTNWNR